jgi:hypothetical protein
MFHDEAAVFHLNWRGFDSGNAEVTEDKNQKNGVAINGNAEKAIWSQVVAWGAGQPFNNVLLLLILFSIAWSGRFVVTIAIPMHLKQIQDGYQSLQNSHKEEREKEEKLHREERESALKTYDKWVDRLVNQNP